MSDFLTPKFSPAQVGELTNIHPDTLRDWRRQSLLFNIGTEATAGHWKYSAFDIVTLWLSERLSGHGSGMSRRSSISYAKSECLEVMARTVQVHKGLNSTGKRYVASIWEGGRGEMVAFGWSIVRLGNLLELEAMAFDRVEIIDLWNIAKTLPPEIHELILSTMAQAD